MTAMAPYPHAIRSAACPGPAALPPSADLACSVPPPALLRRVHDMAARVCGDYRFGLPGDRAPDRRAMLALLTYAYLRGQYHSFDVVRRLDSDVELQSLWPLLAITPEQVRRFRRDHRRALLECLALALASLWSPPAPGANGPNAPEVFADEFHAGTPPSTRFGTSLWDSFRFQAQERLDRAILLDSMALDC